MRRIILLLMIPLLIACTPLVSFASEVKVSLSDEEISIEDSTTESVYVEGKVNIVKGQSIVVRKNSPDGEIVSSGFPDTSTGDFYIKIPSAYISEGVNNFYVKSSKIKGVIDSSNSQMFTVIYTKIYKIDQKITASSFTIKIGDTKKINAKVNSGLELTYSSSNPRVAEVSQSTGEVTGKYPGSSKITISQSGDKEWKPATKNIVVIVTKEENKYSLKLTGNGGKYKGKKYRKLKIKESSEFVCSSRGFSKTGYEFKGWSPNKNGKPLYNTEKKIKIKKDTELFAVWKLKDPKIDSKGFIKKGSKRWDIYKEAKKKNKNIGRNIQCIASDEEYLYAIFKKGNKSRIAKYNLISLKCVKVSKAMNLGHANDITFNPVDGYLYSTLEEKNDLDIQRINRKTLKKKGKPIKTQPKRKKVKAYNGIACDSKGNIYVRARLGGDRIIKLNKKYKATSATVMEVYDCAQGMTIFKDRVYVAQSRGGLTRDCRLVYQKLSDKVKKGNKKGSSWRSRSLKVKAELEGVCEYNKHIYIGVKQGKGKNRRVYLLRGDK